MAYKIVYKKSVNRDLKKIDKNEAKNILDKIDNELSVQPEVYPALKGHFAGLRKYRVGNYRVIYFINAEDIIILMIADRKDVYK